MTLPSMCGLFLEQYVTVRVGIVDVFVNSITQYLLKYIAPNSSPMGSTPCGRTARVRV